MSVTLWKKWIAAALVAAILSPAGGVAQTVFRIVPRVDPGTQVDLSVQRWHDFEAAVSLKVRTNPALVPSARVIELVEAITMVTDAGIVIRRPADIDVAHNLAIAWAGGTTEIVKARQTATGLEVAALFKDDQSRIVTPPEGSLAAYTINGERLCFEHAVVTETITPPPMVFALLLDRSGSMADEIDQVRDSARRFIDDLPDGAQCLVGAFNDGWSFREEDGFGLAACRSEHFPMDTLTATGGTELYPVLQEVYRWMAMPALEDHQKAVIVITDGALTDSDVTIEQVIAKKADALTFVYMLGGDDDRLLKGIADSYLQHRGHLKRQLGQYFEVLSEAYRKQSVLRLKACPVGGHGTP